MPQKQFKKGNPAVKRTLLLDTFSDASRGCKETGGLATSGMPLHETFLTVYDVEKITGLTNIRRELKPNATIVGIEYLFLLGSTPVLLVTMSPSNQYETYKTMVPKNVKSMISGPGEEGFVGPDIVGQMPYLLVFRRKGFAVSLMTTPTADTGRNSLSLEQLAAIGSSIDQRLIRRYEMHSRAEEPRLTMDSDRSQ